MSGLGREGTRLTRQVGVPVDDEFSYFEVRYKPVGTLGILEASTKGAWDLEVQTEWGRFHVG
jgi:hypothetical protein